jgi:hypothetical protein
MAHFSVAQISKKLLAGAAIAALCAASAMAGDTGASGACPLVPIATPSYNLDYLGKERLRASRSAALAFQAECQRQQKEERQAALQAAARREAKAAAGAAAEVKAAEAFERERKEAEADAARQLATAKRLAAEDAERRQRVRKHEAELCVVAEERAKHEAEEQQAAAEERQIAADERAKREADAAAMLAVERQVAADARAKRLAAEESERRQKARKYEAELRAAAEPITAAPQCHGHKTPDGHWTLNIDSWTQRELLEVSDVFDKMNALDPDPKRTSSEVAALLDQFECSADAIKGLIGFTKTMGELKKPGGKERMLEKLKEFEPYFRPPNDR